MNLENKHGKMKKKEVRFNVSRITKLAGQVYPHNWKPTKYKSEQVFKCLTNSKVLLKNGSSLP